MIIPLRFDYGRDGTSVHDALP